LARTLQVTLPEWLRVAPRAIELASAVAPPPRELARMETELELMRVPKTEATLVCRSQPELTPECFPVTKLVAQSR